MTNILFAQNKIDQLSRRIEELEEQLREVEEEVEAQMVQQYWTTVEQDEDYPSNDEMDQFEANEWFSRLQKN